MREQLKEMAKNGKRFSVRDIIAMKENFMKGKILTFIQFKIYITVRGP